MEYSVFKLYNILKRYLNEEVNFAYFNVVSVKWVSKS